MDKSEGKERLRDPDLRQIEISRHLAKARLHRGETRLAPGAADDIQSVQPCSSIHNSLANSTGERRMFGKTFIEYDLSKIADTHGGFLLDEQAEAQLESEQQAASAALKKLEEREPPISLDPSQNITCFECGSPEIDFRFLRVFKSRVCFRCKERLPDKYSLLTKTECKEDYLLTDSELRDTEKMPHMLRPNPHKATYSSMQLYLRYQVEEFAFRKWGGGEQLDIEFERREEAKKKRKKVLFEKRLSDLRKKTRTAEWSAKRRLATCNVGTHEHQFDNGKLLEDGLLHRRCSCGLETEEIQL